MADNSSPPFGSTVGGAGVVLVSSATFGLSDPCWFEDVAFFATDMSMPMLSVVCIVGITAAMLGVCIALMVVPRRPVSCPLDKR